MSYKNSNEANIDEIDAIAEDKAENSKTAKLSIKVDSHPIAKQLVKESKCNTRIVLTEKEREIIALGKSVEPVTVIINGYKYECKKGVDISVPQSIYSLLEKSHKI